MKQIKTTFMLFLSLAAAVVFGLFLAAAVPAAVSAGETCGGVETAIAVDCGADANPIYAYAKGIIRFLAVVIGIVVVGAIAVGGIAYASARGDKGQVAKGLDIIRNAIIGLLLFIGMSAILNFIIPGGLFT